MDNKLKEIIYDLHWMARRYADGRSTYATSMFNQHTKALAEMGFTFNLCDGIIYARDGMGRPYDHLTELEATPGTKEATTWNSHMDDEGCR